MKATIYKGKIYLKPRPKKDIPGGLVVKLNKPLAEDKEPFMATDVEENRKEYNLPKLPDGYYVEFVFVKK